MGRHVDRVLSETSSTIPRSSTRVPCSILKFNQNYISADFFRAFKAQIKLWRGEIISSLSRGTSHFATSAPILRHIWTCSEMSGASSLVSLFTKGFNYFQYHSLNQVTIEEISLSVSCWILSLEFLLVHFFLLHFSSLTFLI